MKTLFRWTGYSKSTVGTLLSMLPPNTLWTVSQHLRVWRVAVNTIDAEEVDREDTPIEQDGGGNEVQSADIHHESLDHAELRLPPMGPSTVTSRPWAWGCPKATIYVPNLQRSVVVLIDPG